MCSNNLRHSGHTQDSTVLKLGVYRYSTEQNIDIDSVLFFKFGSQEVEFSAGMCSDAVGGFIQID